MNKTNIFDIQAAKEFARINKKDNGFKIELIDDALNSIAKRNEYLNFFYSELNKITKKQNLIMDRVGLIKSNGIKLRTQYEAVVFSFFSNLHEMLDSYPFIYLGINSDKKIKNNEVSWEKLQVKSKSLSEKITGFKGDHNFKLLKDFNNYRKHGALPKIKNCGFHLEVNVDFCGGENYKDINELLIKFHDGLLPKYFEILHLTFKES
jgi:hypothetical protein